MKIFLIHVLLPLVLLAAAAAGAYAMIKGRVKAVPKPPQATVPLVRVMHAHANEVRLSVASQGTVEPRTATTLAAEVAGRVLTISPSLRVGGFFDAGETLVTIDDADYRAALAKAEAEIARMERQQTWEQAEASSALAEWQRLGKGEAPPLVARLPQLQEARAALAAATAVRDQARRDLDRTIVRAPYAGRVREQRVDVNDFVHRGSVLARIYATDAVQVRLPLPDAELAHLDLDLAQGPESRASRPVTHVKLTAHFAGKEHDWSGRVVRTEGEIDPKTRMVHVIAEVEAPYAPQGDPARPPLAVGMFVRAEIAGRTHADVVVLPREALRGHDRIWTVDAEQRLRFRTVGLLRAERERVIVANGLRAGEIVVLSPLEAPTDGMRVQPQADAGATSTGAGR